MLDKIIAFIQILLIIPIIIIFFKRIFNKYKVFKIEQIYTQDDFRNKILLYKKKKDLDFFRKITYVSLFLTITMILVVVNISLLCNKVDVLENKTVAIKNTMDGLENNLLYLNTKNIIQEYPKVGLELKKYKWEEIFDEKNGNLARKDIEKELANKLVSYIGNTRIFVSIDFPSKKLFLTINSDFNWKVNIDELEKNISRVITDLQRVECIKQVNYSAILNKANYSTELLRQTFIRKKEYLTLQLN